MSLQVTDVTVGSGQEVVAGKQVSVHYTLTLNGWKEQGGKVVDSSKDRGRPFQYTAAGGQVIKGWDQGVMGMRVGGTRKIIVPPHLGYGAQGAGSAIPGNSTLYFAIDLLNVK